MITQEQIRATIERAEKQKQELQELINSLSAVEVEPEGRQGKEETYWYINVWGLVSSEIEIGSSLDDCRFGTGNYYLTEEDASRSKKQIQLFRLLDRFGRQNGWTDELWEDDEKCKYYIFFDYVYNQIRIGNGYCTVNPTVAYFTSESVAQQAIVIFHDLIMEVMSI